MNDKMSCLASRRGAAALEFGLLSPVFIAILAAIVDIGSALTGSLFVNSAVAAGSNFGLVNAANVTSANGATLANNIAAIVANNNNAATSNVVVNNGPTASVTLGTPASGGTAANANSCYCPTGTATSLTWGSAIACGNSCTGGGTAGKFILVSARYSFTPLFGGLSFVPAGNITAASVVQTQ